MTDEYRQKLLKWLISMLLLALTTVIMSIQIWFEGVVPALAFSENHKLDILVRLVPSFEIYAFTFPALLLWHLADMTRSRTAGSPQVRFWIRYRTVFVLLILHLVLAALVQSRWLDDFGCPEIPPDVHIFDGCGSWKPEWKLTLWFYAFIGIWLVALVNFHCGIPLTMRRLYNSGRKGNA